MMAIVRWSARSSQVEVILPGGSVTDSCRHVRSARRESRAAAPMPFAAVTPVGVALTLLFFFLSHLTNV